MTLSDIRDYIASLSLAQTVYMAKADPKTEQSIGVYNSKHTHVYSVAIGGKALESYGVRYVSFLVHWNKSPRQTETATKALFDALQNTREAVINNKTIKFIQLLYEPQDVGTDNAGICEQVIEAAVVYEKGA